jgi:DNA-binding CsgD family transcriptional regulator/tetratricopeptide (TPR) repeat protein
VELLERDEALGTLATAGAAAARGEGRVVLVSGEPGIGKTSLVASFLGDLDGQTRILLGTCDDLSIPRPLGALRDLVGSVSEELAAALAGGAASHEVQSLLLAELELAPRPTVLVLEDVHWADEATLDSITVLGRRIGSLPALLVLTFRGGEVPPGHPLHAAIGAIRADESEIIELDPLSQGAVASLAGEHADAVWVATAGNPFYVTELLAPRSAGELPPSIANAVVGRASRLDEAARRLVELVSVVPGRVRTSLLDAVMPDWPAAAEEPERRQLLEVGATHVRFRHELARNAIRSSLPIAARRRLHAEILAALLATGADPADIVHHAEAAGAEDVVSDYAAVAARRAAAVDSNREAYSHYRRAADFADRLGAHEQGVLFEELASVAYAVGRPEQAMPAIERAISIYRAVGDQAAVGRCTRVLSRLFWYVGHGGPARAKALEAIAILEPLGESVELARAYSGLSQLAMLAEGSEDALRWGALALGLAERLGDERTRAHALVNLGTTRLNKDPSDTATLLEAHEVAHAAGDRHEATRALANLAYSLMWAVRPAPALAYAQQALAYAREHEVHNLAPYISTMIAWLRLRAGEWDGAERAVRDEIVRDSTVPQLLAKIVLAELAVRRGDDDAAALLADLTVQADRAGELQRTTPVLELVTERALTSGERLPVERYEQLVRELPPGPLSGWGAVRLVAWGAVVGVELELDRPPSVPYSAMLAHDWLGAADGFGEVGWTYDRALMLSLLDDEEHLVEALEIARGLGAEPLTRRVAGRLRELGMRVPQGPRETTRANSAGLTARQLEVLALLVEGRTNAEIAERLIVSPRTAEHHVAAVLAKLGAATRREAARRAAELGVSA